MDFQTRLEEIFKQLKFLWFSVKRGHCRCERFKQFRDSANIVIEIGWIGVRRQLLEGQQILILLNCCMRILTANLWLTCGGLLLLFAWRSSRGAVGNLFLSCCHHVRVLTKFFCSSCHHVRVGFCLWAIELARVMREILHFGVGIDWGAIPSGLPVFPVSVSGCSWKSHGTSPNLWVQKKLVKFRQGTQDTWLCFPKFLGVFWLLSPRSPRRPGRCNPELIQGQVRSVLYCFYCLRAFLSKLLLIFSCFLMLPYFLKKNLVSGEDCFYFVFVLRHCLL